MSLYVIGDLHLSSDSDKPMSVFGSKWENHDQKLYNAFSKLNDNDVTVICGDISWGMNLNECVNDFKFIDSFPGKKIILKGNHDYYWSTASKINQFFEINGITSIKLLHNNSYSYGEISICGTKGWFYEEAKCIDHDKKIFERELIRLRASLDSAEKSNKFVFLHYPPIFGNYRCNEIISILKEYNVHNCFYGHIHGKGLSQIFNGWNDGIEFRCISADYLDFKPLLILKD